MAFGDARNFDSLRNFNLNKDDDQFTGLPVGNGVVPDSASSGIFTPPDTGGGIFGDLFKDVGFNKGTFEGIGAGLGGLGNLAAGWASIKQLGVAKDALNFKKQFAEKNFEASRTTINNRIANQNALKIAQGRTDLAKLVI